MFSKGTVYKGVGGCRDAQLICRNTGLVAGSYEPHPEGLKGQAGSVTETQRWQGLPARAMTFDRFCQPKTALERRRGDGLVEPSQKPEDKPGSSLGHKAGEAPSQEQKVENTQHSDNKILYQ